MSTLTPPRRPRSLTEGIGVPAVRDVHLPRLLARIPRWLRWSIALVFLVWFSYTLRSGELSDNLWFTEAIASGLATSSFAGVLHGAYVGGSAPLYYLLLHFWVNAFGDAPTALRALALVFALATIPVGAWAAWSLGGERAALYAAVMFAFAAVLTQYGQQAQPYTLMTLLGLVAAVTFAQGFVHRRRGWLVGFVAALDAAMYTQESAAFLWFGFAVALAVVVRCAEPDQRRALGRDIALCALAAVVLFIPWIPATVSQIAHATAPWHYAPLVGAELPADLLGGDRVDAALFVVVVFALASPLIVSSRRREPEAVVLYALTIASFAAIMLMVVTHWAVPDLISRYLASLVGVLLLLAALCAARTKIVGFVAVVVYVICCFNPAAFASTHLSNMTELNAQLGSRLQRGDVVAVAMPEEAPLAHYYLASGLRWATTLGPDQNPTTMNWDNALTRLQRAAPRPTLARVVDSLKPGQQLLFIRPMTEGEKDWKVAWASLVRLRAAQWGQLLTDDVANGTLRQVGTAPENYPGDCCVANSAILYRKN